jgi:hypothetical protein
MPTKPKIEDMTPPEEANPLLESARKVLMAAIGAVALAQDEIEAFINRLIERGEIAEKDGKTSMMLWPGGRRRLTEPRTKSQNAWKRFLKR